MIELGEFEGHREDFARRNTRVIAVSMEGVEEAKKTKEEHRHLMVVADSERKLITAANVLHPGAGQGGADTAAPTTFLIDTQGVVRWLFRPTVVVNRLSAKAVLDEVDSHLANTQ
jgi:peroxiredoxin